MEEERVRVLWSSTEEERVWRLLASSRRFGYERRIAMFGKAAFVRIGKTTVRNCVTTWELKGAVYKATDIIYQTHTQIIVVAQTRMMILSSHRT